MVGYRIAEVADLLGINVSMLRAWTLELAAYLSSTAQWLIPLNGSRPAPRYTDADIVILCRAQRLREQGISFEQIRGQLAEQHEIRSEIEDGIELTSTDAPGRAKYAYELALDALHDALRVQGTLIQRLQEETRELRSAHEHLLEVHSTQRSHYLAIIRLLLTRDFKRGRRSQVGV